jgi:oxygen-independent coproporphyrinogen-3 oxidase
MGLNERDNCINKSSDAGAIPIELLRKYDRPGPRYTSYPTAPIWNGAVDSETYRNTLKAASVNANQPLAVYCHIPFCRRRCFYCGCNTYVSNSQSRADEYLDRLIAEVETVAGLLGERRTISQFHFGGGTPTFLDIARLEKIIDAFGRHFTFADGCEKSIELDPRVTTVEQLRFLVSRGFSRASLGVQDFDPSVQEAAGRIQPEDRVREIYGHCRRLGFKGINFDLIYGLPNQTVEGFAKTIDKVIAMRPDRVAVYSFAYLPNLKSHQRLIDPEALPSTETKYRLFATSIEKFTSAGYRQIGMDHFALPEDELSQAQDDGRLHRNFMGYTVQAAEDMIGFGMSAIGYVQDTFFQNHSRLDEYKQKVVDAGLAVYRGMKLSHDDLVRQYVIASLMCNFRLRFEELEKRFAVDYREYFPTQHTALKPFIEDGFITVSDGGLEITPLGRTFVRNIAMTFDAYLDSPQEGKRPTYSRTI